MLLSNRSVNQSELSGPVTIVLKVPALNVDTGSTGSGDPRAQERKRPTAPARRAEIGKQGGWVDDRMLARYTELDENVRENAMRVMFGNRQPRHG